MDSAKRKSLFTTSVPLLYVLLLAVVLLIWILSFRQMMLIVERDAVEATRTVLMQSQQTFVEKLNGVTSIATRTMINPTILRYMRVRPPLTGTQYELLRQCKNTYASLTLDAPFVSRSFLFFHASETYLGDFGASARASYVYDFQYRYEHMTYEEWLAVIIALPSGTKIWPMATIAGYDKQGSYLTYLYTIVDHTVRGARATMCALIPEQAVRTSFKGLSGLGEERYALIDAQGTLLYAYGVTDGMLDAIRPDFFKGDAVSLDIHAGGKHRLLIRGDASPMGIYTVAWIDYSYITGKLAPLNTVFTAIFSVAAAVGILLSLVFARLSSLPMRRISRMLQTYASETTTQSPPLRAVAPSISGIIHINRDLVAQLKDTHSLLKTTFTERLLQAGFDSEAELASFSSMVGVPLTERQYVVVALKLEMEPKDSDARHDTLMHLFHIALERTLSSLDIKPILQHSIGLYKQVALFGWADDIPSHVFVAKALGNRTIVNIDGIQMHMTAGVSNAFSSLLDARAACVEAEFALEYVGSEPGQPTFYSDIPGTAFALYYPLEKEAQLIRFVQSGNTKEAMDVLHEIYQRNYDSHAPFTDQMQRQLAHNMGGTFIRLIGVVSASTASDLKGLYTKVLDVPRSMNREEQLILFQQIILALGDVVSAARKNPRNAYLERILAYVREHCTDHELSLQSVADTFHMSQAYLSRQIKTQTNMTFSELLEGLRMALAQQYMTETDMTIAEVAARSGYGNANTFFKAFKRVFGVSPSTLRRERNEKA